MNAGTKKYAIRIPDELMDEIQERMANLRDTKDGLPGGLSEYVRTCIMRDLGKAERGRKKQATRRTITLSPALTMEAE